MTDKTTGDLVRGFSLEFFINPLIRSCHTLVQRRIRQYCAVDHTFSGPLAPHIPDSRPVFLNVVRKWTRHRERPANADCGALQCQSLHRVPGTTLHRAVPTVRHPSPQLANRFSHHARLPSSTATRDDGAPTPPHAARPAWRPPIWRAALPARREHPRRKRDARSRTTRQRPAAAAREPYAGERQCVDPPWREERVAGGGCAQGAVRNRGGAR